MKGKKCFSLALALLMMIGCGSAFAGCSLFDFGQQESESGSGETNNGSGETEGNGGGSGEEEKTEKEKTVIGKFKQSDYLKVNGTKVKSDYGQGSEVMLRGTNAGGYLVTEEWMNAVDSRDYKTASEQMAQRFGEDGMREAWEIYRSYYWSEQDFKNCYNMGMTVLRLPFTYMNVDINGKYDFTVLDDFVEGAAEYGIYTIIDLHGAYGSQNGQDHSGEVIDNWWEVDFYSNEDKKAKTVALWEAVTEHFLDNPAVAAFDLLNEPGEKAGLTSSTHWDFYDRLYDAVRAIDKDRIVIFESCWEAKNLPNPRTYGWENCMYSYHLYPDDNTEVKPQGVTAYVNRMKEITQANYGVPNYVGEFSCYDHQDVWEGFLNQLNMSGWHWTSWAYKANVNGNWQSSWGIYNTHTSSVRPQVDALWEMDEKWEKVSAAYAQPFAFSSGKTLEEIIRKACVA